MVAENPSGDSSFLTGRAFVSSALQRQPVLASCLARVCSRTHQRRVVCCMHEGDDPILALQGQEGAESLGPELLDCAAFALFPFSDDCLLNEDHTAPETQEAF